MYTIDHLTLLIVALWKIHSIGFKRVNKAHMYTRRQKLSTSYIFAETVFNLP